jgi:glycosyltransferase involved in cell wall biosynthesis/cyclopropane fatty-acyl-phospholipid synthase-like methyltransferase
LKILHASRATAADRRYGLGRATAQLLDGLNQIGVPADLFCADDVDATSLRLAESWGGRIDLLCPPAVRPLLSMLARTRMLGRAAALRAIEQGYTHLHCHDAVIAAGARPLLAGRGIAWGVSQHGFHSVAQALHQHVQPLPLSLRIPLRLSERRTLSAADWVVFPTRLGLDNIAKELGLTPGPRWHAVPHALTTLVLPNRAQARQDLGWPDSARHLLAVGQLIPLKRFELVIDAMAGLPADWRLVLLGDGDAEPYLRRAASLGLAAPIIATADDVAPFLAAADAYVSASATESFGMATLEALAAGLPVVCTDVGGVAEVVGDAALLVKASGGDLADLLARLLADPARCAELSQRGKQRAAHWPDALTIAQRYHALYLPPRHSFHLSLNPMRHAQFAFPLNVYAHLLVLDYGGFSYLHYGLFEPGLSDIAEAQECATALLFSRLPAPPCRILEVGIGTGATLARLVNTGYEALGITPETSQIDYAKSRHGAELPAVASRLEDFSSAEKFDLLLFQESAQYITSPALFQKAAELLREGGEILLMDEVALRENLHGLPWLDGYPSAGAAAGFALVERLDLSSHAAPTNAYIVDALGRHRQRLIDDLGLQADAIAGLIASARNYQQKYEDGRYGYCLLRFRKNRDAESA